MLKFFTWLIFRRYLSYYKVGTVRIKLLFGRLSACLANKNMLQYNFKSEKFARCLAFLKFFSYPLKLSEISHLCYYNYSHTVLHC